MWVESLPTLILMMIVRQLREALAGAMEISEFKKWKANILDQNSMCGKELDSLKFPLVSSKHRIPLFSLSTDCSEKGSRWDYQIQSAKPIKLHVKVSNSIFVTFKIPRKGTRYPNKFRSGFQANKCLKFRYTVAHEFSGHLISGAMEGKVSVKFKDGTHLTGFAKNSVISPLIRYFKEDNSFLNLTAYFQNSKYVIER